jgi:hypothetical protein
MERRETMVQWMGPRPKSYGEAVHAPTHDWVELCNSAVDHRASPRPYRDSSANAAPGQVSAQTLVISQVQSIAVSRLSVIEYWGMIAHLLPG